MRRVLVTYLLTAVTLLPAQFRYTAGLGLGLTFPDYTKFNEAIKDSSLEELKAGWFPLAYSFSLQVYPSLRVGYFKLSSTLLPKKSSKEFVLATVMRGVSAETFFTFWRRFEANFGLVPLLAQAEFVQKDAEAKTTPFQFSASTKAGIRNTTFGFYSWVGLRFYLGSFLAVEANIGYLRTRFKGDKWKDGDKRSSVKGKIDMTQPFFRFGVVAGW